MLKTLRLATRAGLLTMIGVTAAAAQSTDPDQAIQRLVAETAGAQVSRNPATGTARFVRMPAGHTAAAVATTAQAREASAAAFIDRHAAAFGLRNGARDLTLTKTRTDRVGQTHLSYKQVYAGLPVFGAFFKVHFDASGRISVVNGTLVPDIDVSATPTRSAAEAGATAVQTVSAKKPAALALSVRNSRLMIFRTGLVQGVPGSNHLAYEVEVSDGASVREFVYVDAHSGKVLDQISGMRDAMYRRAYDGMFLPNVPPGYPDDPFWVEGDPLPTGNVEADNMIFASQETYDMFLNAFDRDSFDGAGAIMDAIFNRGYSCPNASWNGQFISFCQGMTSDDVTAHEWGHAYTQYTDDLIYQWQPGALNEAASDIFGETVDRINGRGSDDPNNPRTVGECSVYWGSPPPTLVITGGSGAGTYDARASVNEPPRPFTVGPLPMELSVPAGACQPITSDVAGKVVIIDWTLNPDGSNECGSTTRAANAINAGAAGIIFVAPSTGLLNLGSDARIASVEVLFDDGAKIKSGLPAQATMSMDVGTDDSQRWLLGEDLVAVGATGANRDLWNPRCFGNPGKVTDTFEYTCSTADGGGVHTNSGVDNHAFALMVDGGTYNGQTITGIGLTKAVHVYFRAKLEYQGPTTDFPDHADALEQSCADLIGVNLASLTDGTPSGEIISANDCEQVAKAMLAVEMRTPPAHCNFQPLLAQDPPPLCAAPTKVRRVFFRDGFEDGNPDGWLVYHEGTPDFTDRDWTIVSDLPDDREGKAFFAPDELIGTCAPGGDESGVLYLESPVLTVPVGMKEPMLAFDHWVATETGWDGGNLKISVGGKPWVLVQPDQFVFNPYNTTMFDANDGNTNPLGGQAAFSGTDGGAVDGSWGRSIVKLGRYLDPRDDFRLRFELGTDGCNGAFGWYIDGIVAFECR
jgi:Zn-dependent metalloprotease